jgi:hypothetical protein
MFLRSWGFDFWVAKLESSGKVCAGRLWEIVSSTYVFHSPQAGHLPSHLGESLPHWEQMKTVFAFAMFFVGLWGVGRDCLIIKLT